MVADLKYRRKIAEKVFSPELLGARSISEFCLPAGIGRREKEI